MRLYIQYTRQQSARLPDRRRAVDVIASRVRQHMVRHLNINGKSKLVLLAGVTVLLLHAPHAASAQAAGRVMSGRLEVGSYFTIYRGDVTRCYSVRFVNTGTPAANAHLRVHLTAYEFTDLENPGDATDVCGMVITLAGYGERGLPVYWSASPLN